VASTSSDLGYKSDPFALAYPETEIFWEASSRGILLLKCCGSCNQAHWYPRVICPICGSKTTFWKESAGKGEIHSFSIVERPSPAYVLAWIRLAEGPLLVSNLVDCDANHLNIGQKVLCTFRPSSQGRVMPFFSPIS
jgi:uncharacterized OB-fold protein